MNGSNAVPLPQTTPVAFVKPELLPMEIGACTEYSIRAGEFNVGGMLSGWDGAMNIAAKKQLKIRTDAIKITSGLSLTWLQESINSFSTSGIIFPPCRYPSSGDNAFSNILLGLPYRWEHEQ
jgi:hypothetical protein